MFRNSNPSNLRGSLLEGNKDHFLNQARSDLAKQELHVESFNKCIGELQRQTEEQRLASFWCTYTARTLRTFSCVLHTCMAQVFAVRMSSSLFHLALSIPMIHPSLLLLFFHGLFETTFLTLTSTPSCRTFPDVKAQVKRTPHEDEQSGYPSQVHSSHRRG